MPDGPLLSLAGIYKSFGDVEVLKGISFDVARGEFVTLLGPSGCGKTTTLRIIAGLTAPDAGRVLLSGEDVTDRPPNTRNVNTVFQNYALFPHMNVERNIAYGLRMKRVPWAEQRQKVKELLSLVQLEGYERRMPSMLSGGQRQRVAIARAAAVEPDVLLLDEPLGALDLQLRRQMQRELKELQMRLGIAFVYITHDQEEALNMSDRIAVMNGGLFEQVGTPEDIYERPSTRFAARFIGQGSVLEGVAHPLGGGAVRVEFPFGYASSTSDEPLTDGEPVAVSVHAERILISSEPVEGFDLLATVTAHRYAGSALKTELKMSDGTEITANSPGAAGALPAPGATVYVNWRAGGGALIRGAADE